ncbi:MAG: bifunctional UDP-N-acetylglucosamine diphosphorylase/glucosamine-1-phosphate N-acetyltransferase GlmU [Acidobacteriota bacterium]|nr:bifunctional UDP-N-acetylglucosamine diphosphorylase/glucosamine-1-phosphate N-acetyltransferase GlmU [Acidobacteriota bacterium]MDE3169385.1 bifunctional UDP-N-acetylglucosamine diphosphorylase/glucosamine-1-phosphate N-acetyltransferase GlmU [Acidobacteriota bacterium]
MPAADISIVILAAGKGTRMRSSLAKVLHQAGGRTLIEHVIRACQPLKPAQLLAIVGHQHEEVTRVAASLGVETILQQPQRGTGHAMQIARRAIRKSARLAIVTPGDAPLLRTETLAALVDTHRRGEAAATILTAEIADPSGYGRIIRDSEGRVLSIVEDGKLAPEQRGILEINSSIYCFTLEKLWPCLADLRPDNAHRELYLTDAISKLRERNERVLACVAADANEVLGCNTRSHLADIDRIFRARKAAALMDSGVTIYLPETVIIDPEVAVGADTIVDPGVRLLGRTRIGANCRIGAGSILFDMRVDDGVTILPNCNMTSSRLRARSQIGPFARLRPGADIREGAHVGNFVEVKNSVIREGAKAMHLTYLGDASVGRGSNVGAGTITCNYDGVAKYHTEIGDRVFIGSDTALVAPVRIGDGAYVAAGSVITENIPADALGIARGRQSNKPGWARERRRQLAAAKSPRRRVRPKPRSNRSRRASRPARRR